MFPTFDENMAGNTKESSVDNLINDIRELYSKSRSSLDVSCDMVDEKLSRRANAAQRQLARNVAKASKQFEEMFKRRSFAEKMIERSKTVHASSCSTISGRHGDRVCSCEKLKNESSLLPKKVKSTEMCCYGRIPQVFNAPRKLIKHTMGEIVLQLEKRIILHVFPDSERIYYGTLEDIQEVIASERDRNLRAKRLQALHCRVQRLQPLGWDMDYHVSFGNRMMQRYGVGAPAWFYDEPDPLVTHAQLARIITKSLGIEERLNMMTILSCLLCLALEDGRPLFLTCEGQEFQTIRK